MTLIPGFPPPGAYAVADPFEPWRASYWTVSSQEGLKAWPTAAAGKYGPQRPPKGAPGGSIEQRRDAIRFWRGHVEEYRVAVLKAIAADPAGAAARFARETERCSACRSPLKAGELPDSAAAGRGRVPEELTGERRDQMIADLRRAGHPEALIAQAFKIGAKSVNRAARRAGIGAPLKPRATARQQAERPVQDRRSVNAWNTERPGPRCAVEGWQEAS